MLLLEYEPCIDCGFKMPQQAWRTGHDGGRFCTCANCGSEQDILTSAS